MINICNRYNGSRRIMVKPLFILLIFITVPGVSVYGADDDTVQVQSNARIVADETVNMILEWQDSDGVLRLSDGRSIDQPVYLQMNAPAGVSERMISKLMAEGIRLAADSSRYHTLKIEWEPENLLVQLRGGMSRRILRSNVYFSWFDPKQEIQNTWTIPFSYEDEIPSDRISDVINGWDPATFQEREVSRRFAWVRRFAEPAVITGAVAVTIYLLYNVRR